MAIRTAEQIAEWAEQDAETRKPVGAAAHLSPEQKQAIRVAYLETGGSVTYAELGKRCQVLIGRPVNRETVAGCMKGPEYDKLRKHFDTEIKAGAVERLKAGILPAADAWVQAVSVAAEKGDHKPAKDLLMHTGTIEPLDDDGRARGPLVLVMVNSMPGQRGYTPPMLPPAIEADVFPDGRRAIDAAPTGEPLWSDGTRTYTRDEKQELFRSSKGDVVQIGIDERDVSIDLGPMLRDPSTGKVYTEAEAHAAAAERGAVFVGGGVGSAPIGPAPVFPERQWTGPGVPTYRDPATGQTYTSEQAADLAAKRDVLTMGLQLPGLPE